MDWIRRLCEQDAAGMTDHELLDKVGYRLYDRCRDCIAVSDNAHGKVTCPACRMPVEVRGKGDDRSLRCLSCGWASDWTTFHRSWQHMEMVSSGIRDFLERLSAGPAQQRWQGFYDDVRVRTKPKR